MGWRLISDFRSSISDLRFPKLDARPTSDFRITISKKLEVSISTISESSILRFRYLVTGTCYNRLVSSKRRKETEMAYTNDHVIFESKMTVESLLEQANYMDDEESASFTDEQIDELAKEVNEAVQKAVEDFLNHNS